MIDTFREGWTERIKYNLTKKDEDGTESILDLSGLTVALVAFDKNRNAVTFSGTVGVDDAEAGTVYFDPAASDLAVSSSPYSVTWRITDGVGKQAFFPREDDLIWHVKR